LVGKEVIFIEIYYFLQNFTMRNLDLSHMGYPQFIKENDKA